MTLATLLLRGIFAVALNVTELRFFRRPVDGSSTAIAVLKQHLMHQRVDRSSYHKLPSTISKFMTRHRRPSNSDMLILRRRAWVRESHSITSPSKLAPHTLLVELS